MGIHQHKCLSVGYLASYPRQTTTHFSCIRIWQPIVSTKHLKKWSWDCCPMSGKYILTIRSINSNCQSIQRMKRKIWTLVACCLERSSLTINNTSTMHSVLAQGSPKATLEQLAARKYGCQKFLDGAQSSAISGARWMMPCFQHSLKNNHLYEQLLEELDKNSLPSPKEDDLAVTGESPTKRQQTGLAAVISPTIQRVDEPFKGQYQFIHKQDDEPLPRL